MAVVNTFDHSVETQATEVVSHAALCQVSRLFADRGARFSRRLRFEKPAGSS